MFFRYLHEAGEIGQNPARLVRRAICGTPPPRSLTEQGRDRLLAALKARVDEFSAGRRRQDEDIDRLAERISQETEALGTLPARIDTLQESVERFAAAGDKVRAAWLLAEAEHYMRIANAQLGLAGDVDVAQTSLGLADDTLRELNEPRLTPVRKLLAKEINDLKAVPRPDTEGIVLTLGSLADSLEGQPRGQAGHQEGDSVACPELGALTQEPVQPLSSGSITPRLQPRIRGAPTSAENTRQDAPST